MEVILSAVSACRLGAPAGLLRYAQPRISCKALCPGVRSDKRVQRRWRPQLDDGPAARPQLADLGRETHLGVSMRVAHPAHFAQPRGQAATCRAMLAQDLLCPGDVQPASATGQLAHRLQGLLQNPEALRRRRGLVTAALGRPPRQRGQPPEGRCHCRHDVPAASGLDDRLQQLLSSLEALLDLPLLRACLHGKTPRAPNRGQLSPNGLSQNGYGANTRAAETNSRLDWPT